MNDYTDKELQDLLNKQHELAIVDIWTETKPLRNGSQAWVNALAKKVEGE